MNCIHCTTSLRYAVPAHTSSYNNLEIPPIHSGPLADSEVFLLYSGYNLMKPGRFLCESSLSIKGSFGPHRIEPHVFQWRSLPSSR